MPKARFGLLSVLFLSLLFPVFCNAIDAQTYGTPVNFGTVPLGQSRGALTATLIFDVAGTAGTPEALTQGAPDLDFTTSNGGSCSAGQSYQAGDFCTVVVSFTPQAAGLRRGAVVITDSSGNELASTFISGIGSGPQAGYRASIVSYSSLGIYADKGIAIDGEGDIFVASLNQATRRDSVVEIPAKCNQASCLKQLPGTFGGVWGLAVDGAGNLWVGDASANGTITEFLAAGGYGTSKSHSGSFGNQIGVAVDGSGNVLFLSARASYSISVMELTAASGYTTVETLANGINSPGGVAVNSIGHIFYADAMVAGIQEIVAVNGVIPATPTIQTVASGLRGPLYLAIDGGDNLFVTANGGFIYEVAAASGYSSVTQYSNQFASPQGIAIDGVGDIFVTSIVPGIDNSGNYTETGQLSEVPRSSLPSLSYATTTAPGAIDSVDGAEQVILENTGNEPLSLTGFQISNSNFSLDKSTTCSTSVAIAAGESCDLAVFFTPTITGNPITATLTVVDNSQNKAGAQQTIALSGASLFTPTISSTGISQPVAVTQSLTLTITVHGAIGSPVPTGTVQVTAAGYAGAPSPLTNGQATVTVPAGSLNVGAVTLTIQYQPDPAGALNYVPVTGKATVTVTQTLMNQPQVQVLPAVQSISVGQSLTVQVNVIQTAGSPVPTGSVTLAAGSYTSAPATLGGGGASFTIPANSLTIGTDWIVAAYTPDAASALIYVSAQGASPVSVSASAPPAGAAPMAFGSKGIGIASPPTPVTLTFPTGGTPASLIATTQGAIDQDFVLAGGGSCGAGVNVAPGASCTTNVAFTPAYPGLRNGAVVALDSSGQILAMTYVYGTGMGAQVSFEPLPSYWVQFYGDAIPAFKPTTSTKLGDGYLRPNVTVDGANNVYVADWSHNLVQEIPAGCKSNSCAVTLVSGLYGPTAVAVDGAGNLFISESGFSDVKELPLGCRSTSCMQTIGAGFNQPYGLSVDSSGNVFVADTFNGAIKEVVAASGYSTINTLATGLDQPWSVVVDSIGNLFVGQGGNQCQVWIPGSCSSINTSIVEITAASKYKTVTTLVGPNVLGKPLGLAIDGSGNVYEGDYGDGCSGELLAGFNYQGSQSWCLTNWVLGFAGAEGLGRQANGDIVYGDVISGAVMRVEYKPEIAIIFKTATQNGVSDSIDGVQAVYLFNNGNAPLTLSGLTLSDPSFHFDSTSTTCSTSKSIAPGDHCFIGVSFSPIVFGPISATLTVTSNNMNQSGATKVISITAVARPPAPVILTHPADPTTTNSATFTFSDAQSPITFVCSIDSLPFSACGSPINFSALSGGLHTFQVKAVDVYGNLSPAAIHSWTVKSVGPPAPVITSGPNIISFTNSAAFTFTDSRSDVSFLCSLDGTAFTPCTSGVSYTVTGNPAYSEMARHTFAVEAQDAVNNVSPETTYTWVYVQTPTYSEGSAGNFGYVPVGQVSSPQTITFHTNATSVNNPTATIASISAYTMGVPDLDFTVTSPGTCAVGKTVTLGGTCTLQATFTPRLAGQRKGAILLLDPTGLNLGLAYVQGTGVAPQVTFTPYSTTLYNILPRQNNSDPGKNLIAPASDVAIDGAGNLYLADELIASADQTVSVSIGDVWQFAPGCNDPTCAMLVATNGRTGSTVSNNLGLIVPVGMAMDGAGLLWVSSLYGVMNPTFPIYSSYLIGGSWGPSQCNPGGVVGAYQRTASDGAGLLSSVAAGELFHCGNQIGVAGKSSVAQSASGTVSPSSMAERNPNAVGGGVASGSFDFSTDTPSMTVDPQGNLFIVDRGNNAIKEVPASSNWTISKVVGSGFSKPGGIASDTFGNIFVADTGNNAIKMMNAATGYTQIQTVATFDPSAIALGNITFDAQGNLYGVNSAGTDTNQAFRLGFADAPAMNFPTATQLGTTDTVDGTLTATVKNSGNAPLVISGLSISGESFQVDQSATTCSATTTLTVGSSCTLGIIFAPQATGAVTGTLTLTDNALNAASAAQTFALSGTAFTKPATSRPVVVATPASTAINTAQSDVVTVTVTGASDRPMPTGTVSLSGGGYASASVALSNGTASLTIPPGVLALGSNTLNAVYAPDAASSNVYGAATSSTSITVSAVPKSTPTVSVAPSLLDVSTQQSLPVTITVGGAPDGPTPTGSVTLSGGNYASLAVTLTNGSASVTIPSGYLPGGMDTLTAVYMPDAAGAANYNSASATGQVNVEAAPLVAPAVTLMPASNSFPAAQPLVVTVQVSGGIGNPVPTGSVILSAGSYNSIAAPISHGSVILVIPAGILSGGTNTLTAAYAPDKASALTYSPATGTGAVTTTVQQSINFEQLASPVAYSPGLTISLSATGGASGNPVVFTLDASSTGMGSISGATLTVTAAGTFVIDANQAGNRDYAPAPQVQRTVVITQATQSIDFAQPNSPVSYSQGLTIPLSATGGASGNAVVFTVDAGSTGTGSISGNALTVFSAGAFVVDANQAGNTNYSAAPQVQRTVVVAQATQTIDFAQPASPVTYSPILSIQLSASGGASGNPVVFTLDATSTGAGSIAGSTLNVTSAGTFAIDANQAGDNTYSPAQQVQRIVVVTLAPQVITFTQPTSPVDYSQGLTIALSATGGASGNAVIFNIDANSTGTGSINGSTLRVTAAGTFVIDANQAGNVDYAAAPQVQRTVVVNPSASDFTLTMAPAALTIPPGGSGSFTVTANPINGSFSNVVNLSVSGLPAGVTGNFSPVSITPGSSPATSTLTIHASNMPAVSRNNYWPLATTALAVLVLLPLRISRKTWARRMLLLIVGMSSFFGIEALSGCGGGFGLVPPPTTYTLTITGTSGADIHSTTVKLTVQ